MNSTFKRYSPSSISKVMITANLVSRHNVVLDIGKRNLWHNTLAMLLFCHISENRLNAQKLPHHPDFTQTAKSAPWIISDLWILELSFKFMKIG